MIYLLIIFMMNTFIVYIQFVDIKRKITQIFRFRLFIYSHK